MYMCVTASRIFELARRRCRVIAHGRLREINGYTINTLYIYVKLQIYTMYVAKYKFTADDFSAYEEPSWVEGLVSSLSGRALKRVEWL